jgi:hypothetical protein
MRDEFSAGTNGRPTANCPKTNAEWLATLTGVNPFRASFSASKIADPDLLHSQPSAKSPDLSPNDQKMLYSGLWHA